MPFTTVYGVSAGEVSCFVGDNEIVKAWLGKFERQYRFRTTHKLGHYFKCLCVVKGIRISHKGVEKKK